MGLLIQLLSPVGMRSGAPHGGYASSGSGSAGDSIVTSFGDENPELDYAVSSHSSYQQGRAMYTKTCYTPGEPGTVVMPMSRAIGET